jgi:hypothetical protein
MVTTEGLQQKIEALAQEREALRTQYIEGFRKAEAQVNAILKEAGLFERVEVIREEVTIMQRSLQSRADVLTGQIEGYQKLLNESAE